MIDVFVRMSATPAKSGVVAESVRWSKGADPAAARHQVVTLYGDPSVIHLAWAVAAANRGAPDSVWRIAEDGSAIAADLSLPIDVVHDDADILLSSNGPQLRAAMAHLLNVRGHPEHSPAIRVPLTVSTIDDVDGDAMLASLREAEGDVDFDVQEDDIAA